MNSSPSSRVTGLLFVHAFKCLIKGYSSSSNWKLETLVSPSIFRTVFLVLLFQSPRTLSPAVIRDCLLLEAVTSFQPIMEYMKTSAKSGKRKKMMEENS